MKTMLRITADDKIPYLKGSILEKYADIKYLPGGKIAKEDLADCDALLVRTRTLCNAALLDGTSVRFIATATIGFDHIDADYCRGKNIFWTSAPGCNASSVAQYMTSLLLNDAAENNLSLHGKTLGIVGCGHVGTLVKKNAEILGMKTLVCDPPRAEKEGRESFTELPVLAEKSDYITFHVPLAREGKYPTCHLADKEFLSALRRDQFLINTSRGEVIDNASLKDVLKRKRIRGAALDVWENEPEIDRELCSLLDFATPHIAGYSSDGKANGTTMIVRALAEFFGIKELLSFRAGPPCPADPVLDVPDLVSAVRKSYDIRSDDARLRADPAGFEKQRGAYPLRREFPAYEIEPSDAFPPEELVIAEKLGFKVRKSPLQDLQKTL